MSGRYVVNDEFAAQIRALVRRERTRHPESSYTRRQQRFTQLPFGIGFRNDASEDIPAYAVMKVTGTVTLGTDTVLWTVAKPDTTFSRFYLVNGPDVVTTNDLYGTASFVNLPERVLYDSADGTPVAGQVWGPYPSTWKLRRHMYGFRIIGAADTSETSVSCIQDPIFSGVLGKTDASHAKSATGTISVWKGDHSADSGANITSVYNSFAAVSSGKWVKVDWNAETPGLYAAEC